jgi:hypothetical protein
MINCYYRVNPWYGHGLGVEANDASLWLDHGTKLVDRESGRLTYRSQPYELDEVALKQLLDLASQGWGVPVTPLVSSHYPGRTLAVLLSRKAASDE